MDLTDALQDLAHTVGEATGPVVPVGGRTQFDSGDPVVDGCEVIRAPSGIVRFEPADLTVTLGAGKAVLASRLNLTPETFSRSLRELSAAGLIAVRGRQIVLLDRAGLAAAAGAGPTG